MLSSEANTYTLDFEFMYHVVLMENIVKLSNLFFNPFWMYSGFANSILHHDKKLSPPDQQPITPLQ